MVDMAFKHACFISYRHGHEPGVQRIYESFRRELAIQVELYLPGMEVVLDTSHLRGGDFFNEDLASALCNSVCMILLFSPYYFDPRNTYAAREYQAMISLERKRLALISPANRKGLIIPIIIRGSLPDEITKERQYYTLDLLSPDDIKKVESRKKLKRIAEDIYHRHEAFRTATKDPCGLCNGFKFPSEEDVRSWLAGITSPPQRMPWR